MSAYSEPSLSLPARLRRKLQTLRGEGGRRERTVLAFFATSLLARGTGIVCQLAQVPLALHYLGKERFGLWITLASFSYMLSVADFGIGLGAQNRITTAYALNKQRAARRVYLTAVSALGTISLTLMTLVLPMCLLVDWPTVLKLTEPASVDQARGAALAAALCCTGGIVLSMGQRLAFAVHRSWLNNVESILVNVCNVTGVYLACRWHGRLSALVLAVYLPGCVINIFLNLGLVAHLGWFRRQPVVDGKVRSAWLDLAELRGIIKTGSLFFVQQLCALSLFTAPALLISAILGAAAVVPFNLAQRLFSLLLVIPNGILPPLWPAYAEAKAKGDWTWIGRTLNRSLVTVTGLTIVPMALVAFFARDLLRLWTGSHESTVILPSAVLVGMLFVWNALVVMQQPFGFMLAGLSEVRRVTLYSVCTAVTSIVLMFVLGPRYGLLGIVAGLIAAICISLTGCTLEARRLLRSTLSAPIAVTPTGLPAALPVPALSEES